MNLKKTLSSASEDSTVSTGNQINTEHSPERSCGAAMDFHSAEFNNVDGLNDCSGDYRFFEPLGDTITADMRYNMERRCDEADFAIQAGRAPSSKSHKTPSDVIDSRESAPTSIIISRGRTLIIDTCADRAIAYGKHLSSQGLECTILVKKEVSAKASPSRIDQLEYFEADDASISGAFGGFSATINIGGKQRELAQKLDNGAAAFDLVLDLQPRPSYDGFPLPMGYYSPAPGPEKLREVMEEIPEMRGQFKKPKFITLIENRCVHGRSRNLDCRHCLDICPHGAIQSVNKSLFINHQPCQGCGCCAMVCPTDAIQMIQPSKKDVLETLRHRLEMCPEKFPVRPTLIILDPNIAGMNETPVLGEMIYEYPIMFEVEQIGSSGLDIILAALVYGAGRVIVACGPQHPPRTRKALEWQTQMACAILKGLGMPEDMVQFAMVSADDNHSAGMACMSAGPGAPPGNPGLTSEIFTHQHEKRMLIRLAVHNLYEKFGSRQAQLPLPKGSPFGTARIDTSECTLCKACTAACPSGALSSDGQVPRLSFRESLCTQCGFCEDVCPEKAIRLESRLICDPEKIDSQVVMHEAMPFRCVECGAPFASPAIITRMEHKLAGHWMYAGAKQLRRLRMCRGCRTRDALRAKDVAL